MSAEILKENEARMNKAIESLRTDLAGLRTNRAHPSLVENVRAEVYGQYMPLNQLASVSVQDARTLSISVWDGNNTKAVDAAIRNGNLGLNPRIEGSTLYVMLPELTQERREEIAKVIKKKAEDTRIYIRNIRRESNDSVKKSEKDKLITEDQSKKLTEDIQKATDKFIVSVDQLSEKKIDEVVKI